MTTEQLNAEITALCVEKRELVNLLRVEEDRTSDLRVEVIELTRYLEKIGRLVGHKGNNWNELPEAVATQWTDNGKA